MTRRLLIFPEQWGVFRRSVLTPPLCSDPVQRGKGLMMLVRRMMVALKWMITWCPAKLAGLRQILPGPHARTVASRRRFRSRNCLRYARCTNTLAHRRRLRSRL